MNEIPGATVNTVAGVKTDSGCEFSGGGEESPGTIVVVAELSYDPATCTHELATATYSTETAPESVLRQLGSQVSGGESAILFPDGDGIVTPMASYTHTAALWTRIQDIINMTTTETGARLQWNTTSTTVGTYTSHHELFWLTDTGWRKTGQSATRGRTSSTRVWANTTGTFRNAEFCKKLIGGPTTYANHSKTRIEGLLAGKSTWSYTMNKSGGCANMLHYHYVYQA